MNSNRVIPARAGHITALLAVILAWLVLSTGCGTAVPPASGPLVAAQERGDLREGELLYEQFCASCHRPLAKTLKPYRSASRIRSSIRNFAAMQHLDHLTAEQIQALAEALAER